LNYLVLRREGHNKKIEIEILTVSKIKYQLLENDTLTMSGEIE